MGLKIPKGLKEAAMEAALEGAKAGLVQGVRKKNVQVGLAAGGLAASKTALKRVKLKQKDRRRANALLKKGRKLQAVAGNLKLRKGK